MRPVHVHIHRRTRDSWEESKHPRGEGGKFDHGELNIPGRTGTINRDLDRYKAEQAVAAAAKGKEQQASLREHKAAVKALLADSAWLAAKAVKMNTTAANIAALVKEMPYARQQAFVAAYRKETAATRDEAPGKFDESKHKRDGGKFSATEGQGKKSESNAEHSARAAETARAARTSKDPERRRLHNDALQAWADARQKLDPNKPMAEQSAEYRAALKKAEEATAKANEAKNPAPKPEGKPEGAKGKPGSPQKRASASPKGLTGAQALSALRKARREVDPDEHDNER